MMKKVLIIGFLTSLFSVLSLALFFTFSNKNFYLGQISSPLEGFENLNSEIQNLKQEIENFKDELKNEIKERENFVFEIQNLKKEISNSKEKIEKAEKVFNSEKKKIEKAKENVFCQKREENVPLHRVIFNEISWMGDEESPANEWIEIKNVSKEEIDLSGWQVLNKNQSLKFIFEEGAKILPNEILLLKRGDDFSGAIKNSNEALFLFDKDCNLEDEIFANPFWPAGDNFSKRTAERKKDLSWQTSQDPGGTPGKENSLGFLEVEKEEKEPKISLSFPKEVFANQEFKVSLSVSDLEEETYDIKISILKISDESDQKRTISEISKSGEEWQSSFNYLPKVFTKSSFFGDFQLRISEKYQDFKGEAEILAKVRKSSNKKVVAEFKDKIKIKEIEVKIVTPISSQSTKVTQSSTAEETQTSTSSVALNLLSNEFFENWSQGTSGAPPDNWLWNGAVSRIAQSSDALVGNYSVELTLTTTEGRELYQIGKTMNSQTTYYALIWVKGKGVVKLGIKYPASNYVYYGDEVIIDTFEWTKIEVSRKPINSGEDGGIKLSVRYDTNKNIPSGSKLIIGAAWLGETPPPENWPK
jgi:regulator of replication initiation timing